MLMLTTTISPAYVIYIIIHIQLYGHCVYVYAHTCLCVCMQEYAHNSYSYIPLCRFEMSLKPHPASILFSYKLLGELSHRFTFCATLSMYLFVNIMLYYYIFKFDSFQFNSVHV